MARLAERPTIHRSPALKTKILIVEDSKLVHKMYDIMLGHCELVHCYDGLDALQRLAEHPDAALILLDLNMPRMSGLEFLAKVKQDAVFAAIPVVIVSTEGREEDTQRGLDAGAAGYITKPFVREDIIAVVVDHAEGGAP